MVNIEAFILWKAPEKPRTSTGNDNVLVNPGLQPKLKAGAVLPIFGCLFVSTRRLKDEPHLLFPRPIDPLFDLQPGGVLNRVNMICSLAVNSAPR